MTTDNQIAVDPTHTKPWYVRTTDGSVYGPAYLPKLAVWAAEARIVPGCSVSDDGRKWMPAEEIAALKMEWDVELVRGETLGPLHLLAICDLIRDGVVQRGAVLFHRPRKLQATVDDTLFALIAEQMRTELASAADAAVKARDDAVAMQALSQNGLQQQIRDLENTLDRLQKRHAAQDQELRARNAELAQEREYSAQSIQRMREELDAARSEHEATRERAAEADRVLTRRIETLEPSAVENTEMQRRMAAVESEARTRLAQAEGESKAATAALSASQQALAEERERATHAIQRTRNELDAAQSAHEAARRQADETAQERKQECETLRAALNRVQEQHSAQEQNWRTRAAEWERERDHASRGLQRACEELDTEKRQHEITRQQAEETVQALSRRLGVLEPLAIENSEMRARLAEVESEARMRLAQAEGEIKALTAALTASNHALEQERGTYRTTVRDLEESRMAVQAAKTALEQDRIRHAGESKESETARGQLARRLAEAERENRELLHGVEEHKQKLQSLELQCRNADQVSHQWEERARERQAEAEARAAELTARLDQERHTVEALTAEVRQGRERLTQREAEWRKTQEELESNLKKVRQSVDEARNKAAQDRQDVEIQRKQSAQVEHDLHVEIAQIRKEAASTAAVLEQTRNALLQRSVERARAINWMELERGAGEAAVDGSESMAKQVMQLQEEVRLALTQATQAEAELERQREQYAMLQKDGTVREEKLHAGIESMKREMESSGLVLERTMQGIERREEEYRAFRRQADERESNLQKRIVELQRQRPGERGSDRDAAASVEPEVLPPEGRSRKDSRSSGYEKARRPRNILAGMEARAQVELDAWHRSNADADESGVVSGIRKWLRRRKS